MRTCPVLALVAVLLAPSGSAASPSQYAPTALSSQWQTYTSEANGFTVKYPGKNVNIHLDGPIVSLETEGGARVSVWRYDKPMSAVIDEMRAALPASERTRAENVVVNGLKGKRLKIHSGNFEGVWTVEDLFVQGEPYTYEISWEMGKGLHPPATEKEVTAREMISTFRLIKIKLSERMTYRDPAYGFSFSYPKKWVLSAGAGEPRVSMNDGVGSTVWVFVHEHTTAQAFLKLQWDVTNVGPEQELFDHHLLGRRFRWDDRDGFIFERGTTTYVIYTHPWPASNESVGKDFESILNSLQL